MVTCRLCTGAVLRNDVVGRIMMKCLLSDMPELRLGLNEKIEDITFHQVNRQDGSVLSVFQGFASLPAQHSELLLGNLVTVHEAVLSAVSSNTARSRSWAVSILLQGSTTRQASITTTSAAPPARPPCLHTVCQLGDIRGQPGGDLHPSRRRV